jgi:hypothetical protein
LQAERSLHEILRDLVSRRDRGHRGQKVFGAVVRLRLDLAGQLVPRGGPIDGRHGGYPFWKVWTPLSE